MNAILALEDGTWFHGVSAGAPGETSGEVVFNTSMTGYQEVLTDPSYAGQIVTMTAPQIGNYGIAAADHESGAPQVAGFIMRDLSPIASNWRAQTTLREYLTRDGIVAIGDIDTRALTRKLRSGGVMRGVIATGAALDPDELVGRARAMPKMEGADLVKDVTCEAAYDFVPTLADTVAEAGFGVTPLKRAARTAPGRGVRLRHQDQHPAASGRARLRRARVSGDGSRLRDSGIGTGRHLSEQRPGRSGGRHLRRRQRAHARRLGEPADLRHLPRASAARPRARRRHLQAEIRSSRCQSPGQAAR